MKNAMPTFDTESINRELFDSIKSTTETAMKNLAHSVKVATKPLSNFKVPNTLKQFTDMTEAEQERIVFCPIMVATHNVKPCKFGKSLFCYFYISSCFLAFRAHLSALRLCNCTYKTIFIFQCSGNCLCCALC